MLRCKAHKIMRNEAHFFVRRCSAPQQMGVFQESANAVCGDREPLHTKPISKSTPVI